MHLEKFEVPNLFLSRIEKYDRDLKRWEFMDEEGKREAEKMQALQQKATTGRSQKGAAFNILSLQYDESDAGYQLRQRDEDNQVRQILRSKHVDMRGNSGYNVVNGMDRV